MPDPLVVLKAVAVAFAAAAAVLLLCGWPWRAPRAARVSAGAVLGTGAGFYAGCLLQQLSPHWPPKVGEDRLLLVLFPAAVGVELVAAFVRRPRFLAWLLRAVVAAGAARVLLHRTAYLSDLSGPGTAEWTPAVAALTLGCLAAALAAVWVLLSLLMARAPGSVVPLALALTCAGATVVTMLSGYATGGDLGLPLAAGLAGVAAGSFALARGTDLRAVLGPGLVGLFSLLVLGHFFARLTAGHAALLFAAPLLCWLPELPVLRRAGPWLRGLARVALVALPVVLVGVQAQRSFVKDSRPPSAAPGEPTVDDYANYAP